MAENIVESSLEIKMQRDKAGMPVLKLKSLENTAVHVPTKEDYNRLMRVYECGGWKGYGNKKPTQNNFWDTYKKETAVRAEDEYGYSLVGYYQELFWKTMSFPEFCASQEPPITPEMLAEINSYFDAKEEGGKK